jgi:glycosyltransferase involved in cell wall biosynthesis
MSLYVLEVQRLIPKVCHGFVQICSSLLQVSNSKDILMKNRVIKLIQKIIFSAAPTIFWIIYSMKRFLKGRKNIGFLSEEFFSKDFISKRFSDIGGFGMTATVLSSYYHSSRRRKYEATALLTRSLPPAMGWNNQFNGSSVISIPNVSVGNGYTRNFIKYALQANRNFNFLLSIDMYPWYEYTLQAAPHMPLVIWLRDPKGEAELKKIGTVACEITANNMKTVEELKGFARDERAYFKKVHELGRFLKRPIVFATNAKFLVPRAKRLYGLKELDPVFLPNPIHYPDYSKGEKTAKPSVCMLSRLDPVKRPWLYFELAKRFPGVDFIVCGHSGYPHIINPMLEKYKPLENLKFLGLVEGKQKSDVLSKSWVLVNTSIHEGLPCSFLEASAYGTPIISSVNPEDLVSKFGIYTGEDFGDGDETVLKRFQDGLDKLLSDKRALIEKGFEARRYIEKIYTFEGFEKGIREILDSRFKPNFVL